jgi:hypothetical protein
MIEDECAKVLSLGEVRLLARIHTSIEIHC